MEELSAILSKSIRTFMVSDDLALLKMVVIAFIVMGILSMLKDIVRRNNKRNRNAVMLKQIKKQQKEEYERMQSRIERELVLLEPDNSNYRPKKDLKVSESYFKKNNAYVRLFEKIDETMSYGKVCELLGMKGVLQAQSKNRANYIWYLGEISERESNLEQLNKVKGNIKFFFALLLILPLFVYISSGFGILLPKLITNLIIIAVVSIFIDLLTKYYLCLFSLNGYKKEEIYIRVSFVDDRMVSKEQKGLRPREKE